jgi:large subunit ribosomal protein L1
MPNPKTGTVVGPEDVARVVNEVKGGRIDFKVERAGIIHTPIGKSTMSADQLKENAVALLATLMRLKPASAKGHYMRSVSVSSTMGPGIRIDTNEAVKTALELR